VDKFAGLADAPVTALGLSSGAADKQAQHAVSTNPFLRDGLLQGHWLKQ
jgi:hypothetical protein